MSRSKKRMVRVAGVSRPQPAELNGAEESLPIETETAAQQLPVVSDSTETRPTASGRSGLETKAVFWFMLGALTTGIIVLIGLILLTAPPARSASPLATPVTGKAAISPLATATATRQVGVTVVPVTRAPATLQPNVAATFTAIAEANASVPRVAIEEAKKKLDGKTALLVDVRIRDAFVERHIKGAVSVPMDEIDSLLSRLPKDQELILYCS